jgi:acetylglutamate kinase
VTHFSVSYTCFKEGFMRVVKIGGNELSNRRFLPTLATAVVQSHEPVVLVHGGGRSIAELQTRLGLPTTKIDGLRVTDAESLVVAQMVLSGQVNKQIVAALLAVGLDAVGLSGVDGGLLRCRKKLHPAADLGYVGEIVQVRTEMLRQFMVQGITTIISPISLGLDGQIYNINADEAARAIALALGATLLDFVSDVPGVLHEGSLIPNLTPAQTEQLIASGAIRDGMVAKVRAALAAISQGVPQVRIVNLAGLAQAGGTLFTTEEA